MAKLFLSMSGEGRGHAGRALALIEQLRDRHEITAFAPSGAYRMLSPVVKRYGVEVQRIPGITNRYRADQRLDAVATALESRHYLKQFPRLLNQLADRMHAEKPNLVISDFEPALPRAARKCGIPWLSVDHQHWLVVGDLSELPPKLRWHALWIGAVVRSMCPPPPAMVVSSFYRLPLKPKYRDVEQVGVLLRPSMRDLQAVEGEHVLAYFRRRVPANVIAALEGCGLPVRIYGMGKRRARRNLSYHTLDSEAFAAELACCRALVTTAGNQLVGEALHFRKPVLAMAEAGNAEQVLNAYFVGRSGAGRAIDIDDCSAQHVRDFLSDLHRFVPDEYACDGGGTARAVAVIEDVLERGCPRSASHGLEVA